MNRAWISASCSIEFDSLDKALACHDTPAYKEALKVLGTGNVERDMRVVEGN